MKTKSLFVNLARYNRHALLAASVLFFSGFFLNEVTAQNGRRAERNGASRDDAGARQGTVRQEPHRRAEREVAVNRPTPAPSRDFNRDQRPVRIERNREASPGSVNNTPRERNQQQGERVPNTVRNNSADRPPRLEANRVPSRSNRPDNFNNRGNYNSRGNNNRPIVGTSSRPGYRPVYGYNRNPHYNAYNPSWRYGYLPRRHSCFYSLPSTYLTINFGGIGYRYWDGVFYNRYDNFFRVIAPPVGIYINVLPVGYRRIHVRNYPYYYYNGTYYDQRGANYYVVSPPVGAVVESLPAGYETVVIDGETFYTADGAQYKPVIQENGEIWYEVIKAN